MLFESTSFIGRTKRFGLAMRQDFDLCRLVKVCLRYFRIRLSRTWKTRLAISFASAFAPSGERWQ